ncbi:MAG: LD-carboxypeptidase [Desulfobacteraceae bacterium]|uniref:LD-carboxypeptidase n=1 Tax=Candidatus Desulfacyla euxinica TaxID=2841693 RepID=A0A8J6N0P4_9DELT|nr:LD-carboxypeptidase [Candidatus Desulfacyla euxinica]MBL6978848.1 LD-carboxypeptidase [Desulfobacteraceae bacterium]
MPNSKPQRLPLIKPPRLRPEDLIGIISPAGPVDESELQPDLELLESSGFRIHVAPHVYDRHDYLAGDDEARLSDLHAMFKDRKIKAIFCARGGYGTLRLLDKIDYDLIREHPKIIVGYSDITALLMAINKKTGLVTFHGPMVRGLSALHDTSRESLFNLISSDQPVSFSPMAGNSLISGKAAGPLMGGNLSLICYLVGTSFLPFLDGCILFIEDKGEPLYRIDRMLTHLSLAGQLKGIAGLIGGEFIDCRDPSAIDDLLNTAVSNLKIPLITGFPVGHGMTNLTLPLGIPAQLDTDSMTLSTLEPCVF